MSFRDDQKQERGKCMIIELIQILTMTLDIVFVNLFHATWKLIYKEKILFG